MVEPLSKFAILTVILSSKMREKYDGNNSRMVSLSYNSLIQKHLNLVSFIRNPETSCRSGLHHIKGLMFATSILLLIPSDNVGALLNTMLDYCGDLLSNSTHSKSVANLMRKGFDKSRSSHKLNLQSMNILCIFQLWKFINEKKPRDENQIYLIESLEASIGAVVKNYENYGTSSASLVHIIFEELVTTNGFILSKTARTSQNDGNNAPTRKFQLLVSLVSYDVSQFHDIVDKCIQSAKFFDNELDDLVATTILEGLLQKSYKSITHTIMEAAVFRILQKMQDSQIKTFCKMMIAVVAAIENGLVSTELIGKVLRRTPFFMQSIRKARKGGIISPKEIEFLNFLMAVASSDKLREESNTIVKLTLEHIAASIPKIVKAHENSSQTLNSFLSVTIKMLNLCDGKPSIGSSSLKKMMIACLKFGIEPKLVTSTNCLQIVRKILELQKQESNGSLHSMEDLFQPHQIFAMIISHSNFSHVASSRDCPARSELISLLLCCIALDGSNISPMHWESLSALLIGFKANLSYKDCLFKRFIYLYELSVNQNVRFFLFVLQ